MYIASCWYSTFIQTHTFREPSSRSEYLLQALIKKDLTILSLQHSCEKHHKPADLQKCYFTHQAGNCLPLISSGAVLMDF